MTSERWTEVDAYLSEALVPSDLQLETVRAASREAGLPEIDVSPMQGKFLHLLAVIQGARRILEIGTLGGYSTIWLAKALPQGGRIVTLEASPKHAAVATANIARAGCDRIIRVIVGRALETLPQLAQTEPEPFDFIFIDANKEDTAAYFDWALKLSRPGTLIVVDNVVRKGALVEASNPDPAVQGMRRFIERIANEPRVIASGLQTVGAKGYDGFVLARVK
ncbi:MAG TPA: O-methyltransferase [Opitutaceae bacterium]|nr:O-methyltransferase [Opitutaceae bacterium]